MLTLPDEYRTLFAQLQPFFSNCVWKLAMVLVIGAILAPGKRTVTAILRIMGLSQERHFQNYHRVLNRAVWSNLALSLVLLWLLLNAFLSIGPVVIGIDETIERRRGEKIKAKGIYRDPVRSSKSHFVKASGLRWISMMLLVKIPWAQRIWGLPFLTVLAPSERYYESQPRQPKKLTDWARQMGMQVRCWLPKRKLFLVADSSYAALELLDSLVSLSEPVDRVTQLRLDATLYEPAPPAKPGTLGRPRKKGKRLPTLNQVLTDQQTVWETVQLENWYGQGPTQVEITSHKAVWYHGGKPAVPIRWVLIRDPNGKFETKALLCTDQTADPIQILQWFVRRWQVEVTFQEVRTHLRVETQRQWSDKAICPDNAHFAGLILLGNPAGQSISSGGYAAHSAGCLVYQPSRTPSLLYADIFGNTGVFACRALLPICKNRRQPCFNACLKPCAIQLERFCLDKVHLSIWQALLLYENRALD